ncbi:hypothetical protein PQS31_07850 [Luteimonas sp BLCC-B24]|uniref:hypothetical protein n=1 Tax=Luteimonas sp. BLCC-B24 TaxID=3025317 RepID=UPI00234CCD65|nr:hypothetical protein [Luteimonas sp. BLCC-B24]MDC7806729.1 hypothetical protein [Luteimonas sp. BLCC-B24]
MKVIEFLQGVPSPAWGLAGAIVGAIAGAYGTLRATKTTNQSNDARFEKQLEHDATQKSKDRAASLRRDVYLKAVEEVAAINGLLGQLSTVDPTNTKYISEGMLEFFKAMAKASLVANEHAREKVSELSGAYGRLIIELMADANEAHQLRVDINVNRESYEVMHAERSRILAAMRDANESKDSKYKFEALSRSFDSVITHIEELSVEFLALNEKHINALAAYAASTANKISGLADLQAEVSALLRSEFDLDVDAEAMKAQFKRQSESARATGEEFFTRLKAMREEGTAD